MESFSSGFRRDLLRLQLLPCNEIHIYFFYFSVLKRKQTNKKLQHISFLKVFISCCRVYIIIWKHKVTFYESFAFYKALVPFRQHCASRSGATHAELTFTTRWLVRPLPSAEPTVPLGSDCTMISQNVNMTHESQYHQ